MPSIGKKRNRRRLYEIASRGNDRPRCTYCGVAVTRRPGCLPSQVPPDATVQIFTMDHVIPKAHGGCNRKPNLAGACMPCNAARGDMPLDEFIASLGERAMITVEEAQQRMKRGRAASGIPEPTVENTVHGELGNG